MSYNNNQQKISQQEFTYLACSPSNNVIVKACAGSGKTWLLASRIVRILIEGGHPESILAITFTKKSAYEMKHRVISWLEYFSTCSSSELKTELTLRDIKINEENILRAKNLYFNILSAPQNLQISTFHVWFLSLINSAPSQYVNTNNIRCDENFLYDECINDFINSSIYIKYQDIFNTFMQQWNINSIINNNFILEFWKKRGNLIQQDLFSNQNFANPSTEHLHTLKKTINPSLKLNLMQINLIDDILIFLKPHKNKIPQDIYNSLIIAKQNDNLQQVIDCLLTNKKTIRVAVTKAKGEFEALTLPLVEDYYTLQNNAYITIAKIFLQAYNYFKQLKGVIDFCDIEKQAYLLSSQDEVSQYIWCKLDNKYKHILIDEFQDTNLIQWQIIKNWLQAYGEGTSSANQKPSIFIVGDVKQSIYAFRGSDSSIFQKASLYLSQFYKASQLATYHTRRCAKKIIEWVNLSLCHDEQDIEYKPHTTDNLNGECILINPAINIQQHSQQIIECINSLTIQYNFDFKDILILSSNRKLWYQLKLDLQLANIPVFAQQEGGLLKTPEVYIIINLIRFLLNNNNNYALCNILTSPIFNFNLAEILSIIDTAHTLSYWEQINQLNIESLNINLNIAITKLIDLINIYYLYTPYDLLQYLCINLDISFKFSLNNPTQTLQINNNLRQFLNIILDYNGGRYPSLTDLLEYLLQYQYTKHFKETPSCANYSTQNAVTFNTIHGAKGLEFPVVILIDSYNYKSFSSSLLISQSDEQVFFGNKNIQQLLSARKFTLEYFENQHYQEYKNLLYVAMTRAKQIFIASSILPTKKNNYTNIWYDVLAQAHNTKNLENFTDNAQNKVISSHNIDIDNLSLDNIKISYPNINIKPRQNINIGQQTGKIMHDLLEKICRFKDKNISFDFPNIEQAMIWLNLPYHQKFMLEIAIIKVKNILDSSQLQTIFNPKYFKQAYCEISFNFKSNIYRIDRLIKNLADEFIIVDYKLGDEQLHLDEYIQQLNLYKLIIKHTYKINDDEQQKIKAGIINSQGQWINI